MLRIQDKVLHNLAAAVQGGKTGILASVGGPLPRSDPPRCFGPGRKDERVGEHQVDAHAHCPYEQSKRRVNISPCERVKDVGEHEHVAQEPQFVCLFRSPYL